MKKHSSLCIALLGVLALSGCATKIAGLKQSPTFTFPSILSGKLAVGGVVSAHESLDEGRRSAYANLLRTQLLEERKEYNIVPVGMVINKVGKSQYQAMMSELQSMGSISDRSEAVLKSKMPEVRYVVFSRIENDEVTTDRRENNSTDKNGKVIPGSEKVVCSSSRNVTASLHIVDLKAGDEAFSGSVTKSSQDSRQYDKEKETELVSVIKAIKGDGNSPVDQKYPFPPAPDSSKVLAAVFAGFGENLPKKD